MAKYTRDDILDMIEEEDIEFIRLQFTDIAGNLKNMATTVDQIDKILDGRCQFDCAAIDGFDGDMEELFLIPDLDTFVIFPWRPQHGKVARFICDIVKPDGTPFDGDSRYILKRIIAEAKDMGYDFDVALKNEFFLFDLGENGEPTQNSSEKGGYFDVGPADCGENARRDMVLYLADMGISTESSYHSDEAAQHVLDMTYTNALTMADNIMTSRLVIRTVAKRHGLHATFMPKPKKDSKGSGAHYTFSLSKNGKNIFTDADDSAGVSKEGYAFMAGILEHIADMSGYQSSGQFLQASGAGISGTSAGELVCAQFQPADPSDLGWRRRRQDHSPESGWRSKSISGACSVSGSRNGWYQKKSAAAGMYG